MDFLVVVQPADTDDPIAHFVGPIIALFETTFCGEELPGSQLVGVDVLFPYGDCAEFIDDSEERPRFVEKEVVYRRTLHVGIELRIPVLEICAFCRGIV
jgi:hypothetical protein